MPLPVTLTEWLAASSDTRRQALARCVELIAERDATLKAWTLVRPQEPAADGPLSGIPFGAKDIIETRGLPTEYGSPIYKGRIGGEDAAIVRALRAKGAVLLGKTQTAAFAHRTPAPTRNPRAPAHTPGGSSSGSAAAVAAGMVPLALGTQTKGSVLRPASYCGVTGFKASFGLLPLDGVLPLAKSLDTLGFFTHTPADMLALWTSLGYPSGADEEVVLGVPAPLGGMEPPMAAVFAHALVRLRQAGVPVETIDLEEMLTGLCEANDTVMHYEGARFHEQRYHEYGARLDELATLVRTGLEMSEHRYDEARRYIDACKARIARVYKATPVIVVPAATGPAPHGLGWTGDARMNSPWTTLGTPAISIPMPVTDALPLGLQLTAAHGEDARLLRTAGRVHRALGAGAAERAGV